MQIRLPYPTVAKDQYHEIDLAEFMKIVCLDDLASREPKPIEDAYHENWLTKQCDGSFQFCPTKFSLRMGAAFIIDGRHRLLLLKKHLEKIPMTLTGISDRPGSGCPSVGEQACDQVLRRISIRKANPGDSFCFPNLPIKNLGLDLNRDAWGGNMPNAL